MASRVADASEFLVLAAEALGRYKLRTFLSVLGVILGVAAVIAMMSVSDGARLEALKQVEALGLDNLVARSHGASAFGGGRHGLVVGDADRVGSMVPLVQTTSPLIERFVRVAHAERSTMARVLGVRAAYQTILRLSIGRGRFLAATDDASGNLVCVLGPWAARRLFGFQPPIGDRVRIGSQYYEVVGVLRDLGTDPAAGRTLAWRDLNEAVLVPLPALSGRTLEVGASQPTDELWVQVGDSDRVNDVAAILDHTLARLHGGHDGFDLIVPRELLAQRYRTQRTFSIVVGSVAALALLVGGIGIMNIMLASVVERTHEIGIRRTLGATRRNVTVQFLIEALLMTIAGGLAGIALGVAVSWGITAYAGWSTHVSTLAVTLAVVVSMSVGLGFGLYPAVKAARLDPVDALRYE